MTALDQEAECPREIETVISPAIVNPPATIAQQKLAHSRLKLPSPQRKILLQSPQPIHLEGRLMIRRVIIISILALVALAWLGWSYALPHTTLSEGPMPYSQAQSYSPITLPPAASNIRVARLPPLDPIRHLHHFEAPLTDCRSLAHQLLPGSTSESILHRQHAGR